MQVGVIESFRADLSHTGQEETIDSGYEVNGHISEGSDGDDDIPVSLLPFPWHIQRCNTGVPLQTADKPRPV